ncbi:TIR domain-containing adapter molecule 1 [Erpetoichthys calabaricus]|uniref:TIR domain-containing protein n=1 Tax=Erpetoichthys calabaricus TaxID=27687 RepID=A0A8C4TMW3_ERPCA|nr:TIR domain-containing adapter molecule 1 [Erpetoichthys calabaricus]XP_028672433.1 TIR domain-containing adapter molecule 1 [Erpetoichthys calabaricus]XP_051790952.1 TIR domain-containing adapter molecule 1 [Erpetoichthys calabaricus]
MAEKQDPTLEDAFQILSKAPKERLLSLSFRDVQSCADKLIHSMILMKLGRTVEARVELEKLDNQTARYITKRLVCESPPIAEDARIASSQRDPDFLVDVARIFKVLVAENLCEACLRDDAYVAAVKAYERRPGKSLSSVEELIMESRRECGPHLNFLGIGESEGGLTSQINSLSPSPSPALLCPWRSCDNSSFSGISHLEISQSPTVCFASKRSGNENFNSGVSSKSEVTNAAGSPSNCMSNSHGESLICSTRLSGLSSQTFQSQKVASHSVAVPSGVVLQSRNSPPVDSKYVIAKGNSQPWMKNGIPVHRPPVPTPSESDESLGALKNGKESATKSAPEAILTPGPPDLPSDAQGDEVLDAEFFSFVLLHAPEDAEQAEEVQETLERLGAGKGATFSQDFEQPGKCRLSCLQDAINNSAFTVILLTRNFNSRWAAYKTNSVLTESIENRHKYNTVIPFMPKKRCASRDDIPYALRCINALDEKKPGFEKKVKKTFDKNTIEKQRSLWLQEQRISQKNQKEALMKDSNRNLQSLCEADLRLAAETKRTHDLLNSWQQQMYLQFQRPPFPPSAHCPLPPGMLNPFLNNGQPYFISPAPCFTDPAATHTPGDNPELGRLHPSCQPPNIIQIHHAQNIQIGDHARMSVSVATENLEDDENEEEVEDT